MTLIYGPPYFAPPPPPESIDFPTAGNRSSFHSSVTLNPNRLVMDMQHLEQAPPSLALPANKFSQSPEPQSNGGPGSTRHRRNYQACERCRTRKVKCDLGPVDAPHDPPCARCRRENKQCHFALERKKDKSKRSDSDDSREASLEVMEGQQPTLKKRKTAVSSGPYSVNRFEPAQPSVGYPGGYAPYTQPGNMSEFNIHPGLQHSSAQGPRPVPPSNWPHNSKNFHSVIHNSNFHPEIKKETGNLASLAATEAIGKDMSTTTLGNLNDLVRAANTVSSEDAANQHPRLAKDKATAIAGGPPPAQEEPMSLEDRQFHERALRAWRSMRFVRAGWFTAEEAMAYMAYFSELLQPMTPVIVSEYLSPRKQPELLLDEPVLAVSILAITSRHMGLRGHSHSTRAFLIHEALWGYLRRQVQRLLWAQEQFGGGFTGAGAAKVKESPGGQITWQGTLRKLGTVEALLLLTDWQPRALHFPPGNDEDQLLAADYEDSEALNGHHEHDHITGSSHDSTPYAGWLEPAWRSDKMSWMLLGVAQALSFELGVFDKNLDGMEMDPERTRKLRLRKLVLVYVAQVSGRIGIPSPLRLDEWTAPSADLSTVNDSMIDLWFGIANLMNQANREIFPSRQFTKKITSGQEYRKLIADFVPKLAAWKTAFAANKGIIDETMQHVLLMEYEYARLYINSLGMQNVVEVLLQDNKLQNSMMARSKLVGENKVYIDELTSAAINILDLVAGGLGERHLKNAPVRTFLRNLSAMMFALKRLSFGADEKVVRRIIEKLERAIALLAKEVVDDVHLSSQTSRLMQILVNKVKDSLIRVERVPNTSNAASRDQSRPQTPHQDGEQRRGSQSQHDLATTLPQVNNALTYGTYDPLAGIPARQMNDLQDKQFVPPPNFNFNTNDFDIPQLMDDNNVDHSVVSGEGGDWFASDIGNIWNSPAAQADQGAHSIGPTVGNRDWIELIHSNTSSGAGPYSSNNNLQWPMESPTAFHHYQSQW